MKSPVTALSPDAHDVRVVFLLSVPASLKSTLLSAASLLLYTPANEHFGIVPVEAMAAGLPVLAANSGGPLETIVEDQTGWLRDPNDVQAWTEVCRRVLVELGPERTGEMGVKGRERVKEKFSDGSMADALEGAIGGMFEVERGDWLQSVQDMLFFVGLSGVAVAVVLGIAVRLGVFKYLAS